MAGFKKKKKVKEKKKKNPPKSSAAKKRQKLGGATVSSLSSFLCQILAALLERGRQQAPRPVGTGAEGVQGPGTWAVSPSPSPRQAWWARRPCRSSQPSSICASPHPHPTPTGRGRSRTPKAVVHGSGCRASHGREGGV